MTKKILVLTAALFALATAGSAHAGSLGGVIQVSLTIVPKCAATSTAGDVKTACTAGDYARVERSTETQNETTYIAQNDAQDDHNVVTVSF